MTDTPLFLDHHPYFADNGLWSAEGWYFDDAGHMVPAKGWTRVRRARDIWTISSELRLEVFDPDAIAFRSVLSLEPPAAQSREVFWSAENPALGAFAGRFTAVGDTLMAVGFSEDGLYQMVEIFIMGDPGTYHVRGSLARESETQGAWALTLVAEDVG